MESDELFRSAVAEAEYPHSTRMHLEPATTDYLSAGCIHTNADGDKQDNGLQNEVKNNTLPVDVGYQWLSLVLTTT